jgi:hypothetical protein
MPIQSPLVGQFGGDVNSIIANVLSNKNNEEDDKSEYINSYSPSNLGLQILNFQSA